MNEKQIKILAGAFVFLLVLFFVTKPRSKSVDLDKFTQNIVIGVAQDDVKELEIYKEQSEGEPARMQFVKLGDQWRLMTYHHAKAQNHRVDRYITELLDMTGKVRTDDPKHHASFQITDEMGMHVLLKDETGKTLSNLIVGKKPEDTNNSFVRFAGSDKVYFTDKNLITSLGQYGSIDTLTAFAQKGYVDLLGVYEKKDALALVGMVDGRQQMIVEKVTRQVAEMQADSTEKMVDKDVWVLKRGENEVDLDQAEVDKFFGKVLSIRGTDVVDRIGNSLGDLSKGGQYGVGRPQRYIVLRTPDGQQKNIIFGKEYEKDQGYYMQVQYDEGLIYKISKTVYDDIWKWMKDLPEKTA